MDWRRRRRTTAWRVSGGEAVADAAAGPHHEARSAGTAFVDPDLAYDPLAPGGNTIIEFDPRNPGAPRSFAALGGTSTNCAGGMTPWGTWLTCEETLSHPGSTAAHGYVFEVPAWVDAPVAAEPLTGLGRFVHEALAVNPKTGVVHLTEDAGSTSGFYRFVPRRHGRLAHGGQLQMLKVLDQDTYDASIGQTVGARIPVEWVDIDDPDPAEARRRRSSRAMHRAARGSGASRARGGATKTTPSTSTPPTGGMRPPVRYGRTSNVGAGITGSGTAGTTIAAAPTSSSCTSRPHQRRC
jgi:Bacterial protein of unknown function (DUF839)